MQTLGIFTIFDSKAEAYLQPFFSAQIATAKREFSQAVNGDGSFNKFAEDYALYYLGEFNQHEGTFTLEQQPKHICNAVTLKSDPVLAQVNMDNIQQSIGLVPEVEQHIKDGTSATETVTNYIRTEKEG